MAVSPHIYIKWMKCAVGKDSLTASPSQARAGLMHYIKTALVGKGNAPKGGTENMALRKKLGRKQSKRIFRKHAKGTHKKNVLKGVMRGGFRI